jgi:hypothetical protein
MLSDKRQKGVPTMQQYVLSLYQPDGDPPPPEVLEPIMAELGTWRQELMEAGAWVFTAGLHPPHTATVLRLADSDVLITDGPYTEGKEHVGGFTVIQVPDLDAALDWAGRLTKITSLPTEVRPIRPL